jgi:hypothetical protein
MNEEKKKQIADHHDNVTRLVARHELISEESKYLRDKGERNILYMRSSWNRVVDMKIAFYDKVIDLELFFLKLFIPIFGISFATSLNIIGINVYILRFLSLWIAIFAGLLITITVIIRKRIIDSEHEYHKQVLDLAEKQLSTRNEKLDDSIRKFDEDVKLALENEPNLQ